MRLFSSLYQKALELATHRLSTFYLCLISMVESFILPYPPPDIMLAPMVFMRPHKAYYLASLTTIFSVLGGIIGYVLGYYFIDAILPIVNEMGYDDKINIAKEYFNEYGILIIFVAGFSPIPFKVFTVAAGILAMSFIPFVIVAFIARGLRFFLVALFVRTLGERCDALLKKYIDYLGYTVIILVAIFILYTQYHY